MNRLLWMGCLSYLLIGLAHVVIGSLLPEILDHYGRSYSDGGRLVFAQFGGFLIGVLFVPWLTSQWGRRGSLLLVLGILAMAEIAYGFLPEWHWMFVIGFLAGFGFGSVEAIIGSVIIEYIEDRKAVAMTRLEVFFGVGALLMPIVASSLIINGLWQFSFFILGLFSLIMTIIWGKVSFGKADEFLSKGSIHSKESIKPNTFSKKEIPLLVLFIVFFLLYVGIEMSIVNFLPSILIINQKVTPALASLSVTFFWMAMSIGRLLAGVIAEKIKYSHYLLWSSLGSVIFLIAFGLFLNIWGTFVVIILLGLIMSGIFSIALLFANHLLPGKTEQTTSILIASGGIGGALLPLLTGWSMEYFTVELTIRILVGMTALMFILSLIAFRIHMPGEIQRENRGI